MQFIDIIGQAAVKTRLLQSVKENRVSHSLLFQGAEGVGNLPIAIAFAQYLFCKNKTENDSCGTCSSCVKITKLIHPDLHLVFPIAYSKTNGIEKSADLLSEFRASFLKQPYMDLRYWMDEVGAENKQATIPAQESSDILQKLSLTSFEGGYKIMIIWMPEKMNASSANKILKILEEPPDQTIFILVTHYSEQILPTILSRTQLIKLDNVSDEEIINALIKRSGIVANTAANIARLCDGNYFQAQLLAYDADEITKWLSHFQQFMRGCLKFDMIKISQWIEETSALGREKQKQFLHYSIHLFRSCLMQNFGSPSLVKLGVEETEFIIKFSPFIHLNNFEKIIEEFNKAYYHIERNANPKILFIDLALKINELLNTKKPD